MPPPATEGVPALRLTAPGRFTLAALGVALATCSSPTTPAPVVNVLVQSISPNTGSAAGGTDVTIRGSGFAAGASVTIGGVPATDVNVRASDMITAKTPASAVAGTVDIVATVNGKTSTLAGGFRYEVVSNTPPVIKSITAQGTRLRQPPLFADFGETIRVAAVVEDLTSPAAQLKYEWHACGGTFTGTGAQVDWTTPSSGTIATTCTIELIVSDGPRVATGTLGVRLHDSAGEVGGFAKDFLEDFANSTIPAELTVRNFWNSCPGKAEELKQVVANRENYTHVSHTYGDAKVTIAFGAMCKTKAADACVITPVEWRSIKKATGQLEVAKGFSIISAVYRDTRWWLCDSLADDTSPASLWPLFSLWPID